MGFDFGHFRGPRGPKLRNNLKKKSKLSCKLKLIVSKLFFFINHIYIIQL